MNKLSTTKMSSEGQIVIPEEICSQMGLIAGDDFIIIAEKDMAILKLIKKPSLKEYTRIIKNARLHARRAGMIKEDIAQSIKAVRAQDKKSK